MSRRDIIIIAVLINAGLLIVLFASALKSNPAPEELSSLAAAAPASQTELALRKDPVAPSGDEVDQVLREYSRPAQPATSLSAAPETTLSASPENKEIKTNFAEDLQALTAPSAVPSEPASAPLVSSAPVVSSSPVVENSAPQMVEVKVKKGDVLEKIAKVHNTSVEEIMKANHLSNSRLKIGQVLKVPKGVKKTASNASKAAASPKFYTVKNGDNPWTIAVKNHMKVEELLKLNNMDADKARRLKPGDQIRIQ